MQCKAVLKKILEQEKKKPWLELDLLVMDWLEVAVKYMSSHFRLASFRQMFINYQKPARNSLPLSRAMDGLTIA